MFLFYQHRCSGLKLKTPLCQSSEAGCFKFALPTKIKKVTRKLILEQENVWGKKDLLYTMNRFTWETEHCGNVTIVSILLRVWDRILFLTSALFLDYFWLFYCMRVMIINFRSEKVSFRFVLSPEMCFSAVEFTIVGLYVPRAVPSWFGGHLKAILHTRFD